MPTSANSTIPIYVNFLQNGTSAVPLYVNFFGGQHKYLPLTVNFKKIVNLSLYVNFINQNVWQNLPLYVNFVATRVDVPISVNFLQNGQLTTPLSVYFQYGVNLPITATFIQTGTVTKPISVNFKQIATLPITATFLQNNAINLPITVFLGHLVKTYPIKVIFNQTNSKTFKLLLNIQKVVTQSNLPTLVNINYPITAYMIAKSTINLPITVNFTRNPKTFDTPITVYFKAKTNYNFPFTVQFTANSTQTFKLNMQIVNKLTNGGGIPISVSGSNNASLIAYSDSTGTFQINNLVPGIYTVVPIYTGLVFIPNSIQVTITNSNITLNFDANGNLINQVASQSILPIPSPNSCLINPQQQGNAGTYSIEGYISLGNSVGYSSVLTIISDELLARQYRETLQKVPGGLINNE